MRKMVSTNINVPRAHILYVRYLCGLYGMRKLTSICAAVEVWGNHNTNNVEAVYLRLRILRVSLSSELSSLSLLENIRDVPMSFLLTAQYRSTMDLLCNYIETMPPVRIPYQQLFGSGSSFFLHFSDFRYPFCGARRCPRCGKTLISDGHYADDIASVSLVVAWTMWKALAYLLGPLSRENRTKMLAKQIHISVHSEYFKFLQQRGKTSYRSLSMYIQHGIHIPRPDTSGEKDVEPASQQPIQNYFHSSRVWWKNTLLSSRSLISSATPDTGIRFVAAIQETASKIEIKRWSDHSWCALNWLWDPSIASAASSKRRLIYSVENDWTDILRIGGAELFTRCQCDAEGVHVNLESHFFAKEAARCSRMSADINRYDIDGDISCNDILKEMLSYQIVVSCHLHGGCQDNIFALYGIKILLGSATQAELLEKHVAFLTTMNVDVARAVRLLSFIL